MAVQIPPTTYIELMSTMTVEEIENLRTQLSTLNRENRLFTGHKVVTIDLDDIEIDDPQLYAELKELLEI